MLAEETVQLSKEQLSLARDALTQIGELSLHLQEFIEAKDSCGDVTTVARSLLERVDTLSVVVLDCLEGQELAPLSAVTRCSYQGRHLRPEVAHG